ncbi:MAG TPA: Arc family DNA-binding protein [Gammaproteobacteria bacterium]|nr:Arc family DNA-binding protein [Gammaproteobacteria bacterium]
MPTITVKNVPVELYESLKESAHQHRRSINSEAIVCLEQSLHAKRITPKVTLARIRALQKKVSLPPLTDALLRKAKNEGRP